MRVVSACCVRRTHIKRRHFKAPEVRSGFVFIFNHSPSLPRVVWGKPLSNGITVFILTSLYCSVTLQNMQFLWALIAALAATAFVPLIAILVPYAWFHVYIHQMPLNPSHPHMKEALASLQATCIATGCLLPPVSFIPFLCDPQAEANLTKVQSGSVLFRLTVDQGVFYESVTRNISTTGDFSLLSELDNTIDIVLSYDSLFLLLQDGAREVSGVSDVLLLSNIQKTSRVALRAIY